MATIMGQAWAGCNGFDLYIDNKTSGPLFVKYTMPNGSIDASKNMVFDPFVSKKTPDDDKDTFIQTVLNSRRADDTWVGLEIRNGKDELVGKATVVKKVYTQVEDLDDFDRDPLSKTVKLKAVPGEITLKDTKEEGAYHLREKMHDNGICEGRDAKLGKFTLVVME